jgi:hypothetical protein
VQIQPGRTANNEVSFQSLFLDLNMNTESILTVEAGTQQTIRKRLTFYEGNRPPEKPDRQENERGIENCALKSFRSKTDVS